MSIDLAVWDGPTPSSDAEAANTFNELYEQYIAADEAVPPSPKISEFVHALLGRYPDLTGLSDEKVASSPWAAGPLIEEARGPIIYFAMVPRRSKEAWNHAVETARTLGLVCYDPQSERLARPE